MRKLVRIHQGLYCVGGLSLRIVILGSEDKDLVLVESGDKVAIWIHK